VDYIDTSALVKLVVHEAETSALRQWLDDRTSDPVASDLARVELLRAVRRVLPQRIPRARRVLDSITLIRLTSGLFDDAGRVDPIGLRSLDALHLAAALDLGDELESFVTYDERLAAAAAPNGRGGSAPV
jgi:predicted nucleic acid-binding protein